MKNRKLILLSLSVFYITISGCCMLYFYKESATTHSSINQEYSLEPASADSNGSAGIFSEEPTTKQTTEDMPKKEEISSASKDNVLPLPAAPIPFSSGIKKRINIRSSPQMSGTIIGKIPPYRMGEILKIIDDEWALVSYEETTGYAAYRYLRFSLPKTPGGTQSTEVKETAASANSNNFEINASSAEASGSSTVKKDSVYIVEGCYIRSTPEWDSTQNILRAADKGTTYPHVPNNDTPNFYAILLPNKTTAYVSIFYTEIKEITEE